MSDLARVRRGVLGSLNRRIRTASDRLTEREETRLLELARDISTAPSSRAIKLQGEFDARLARTDDRPGWWRDVHDQRFVDWEGAELLQRWAATRAKMTKLERRRRPLSGSERARYRELRVQLADLGEQMHQRRLRWGALPAPLPPSKPGPRSESKPSLDPKNAADQRKHTKKVAVLRREARLEQARAEIGAIARQRHISFRRATLLWAKSQETTIAS